MSDSEKWLGDWLDTVVDGRSTMSQRKMSSVDKHGGLSLAASMAKQRGVHLLQLTDDKGDELLAASLFPFKVVC